ncbi:MAG: class I SAM-dependent methyltransferase [Nitrospirae bacterium]|nr:class I SAM-dependent methyltransferase [Nitrospirota bacterium]
MKLSTISKLTVSGQSSLMFQLLKMSNEFYRLCFVSAALSNGVYDNFIGGKASFERLCEKLGIISNREGLRAWLELGVSLGELKRAGNEYQIKGKLSKTLMKSSNDAYKALLEEIVRYHYPFVMDTPAMLKEQKLFPFDESTGELVARSSRISEPFIFEAVDAAIPAQGDFTLLEIGCGSGIYIQRACARNSRLRAVGLDLQEKVADFARNNITNWGLDNRVTIKHCDVRGYSSSRKFDLITLHQNIYYFPAADRVTLFRHLNNYLKPGGWVLLTTVCQGGSPIMQILNIWASTSEGYGPLPYPEQLCQQFKEAGFAKVKIKRLIPFESFWAFVAAKPY